MEHRAGQKPNDPRAGDFPLRYADRITFRRLVAKAKYNPETGLTSAPTYQDTTVPCEIGPVSAERTLLLFGAITLQARVVRLQRVYTEAYEEIRVGGRAFEVLRQIDHDTGRGFTGLYIREKVG